MNTEDQSAAAVPHELQAFTSCPEWGSGGQFIYDPVTKTRTRVGGAPALAGVPSAVLEAQAAVSARLEDEALASLDAAAVSTTTSVDAAASAVDTAASVDAAAPAAAAGTPLKKERNRG